MGVDQLLITWINSYLTGRPQYVRLGSSSSETIVTNVGAPQGTVLSPFLFTMYTADFTYKSELCHIQKYSDDTAVVACVKGGNEVEYRELLAAFTAWSRRNGLILNISKTKEMIVDFRQQKFPHRPVEIGGQIIETVQSYKYLGMHLSHKLDWSVHTDAAYKKRTKQTLFLKEA